MNFLERLRSYLQGVERAPEGLPHHQVDVAAHRRRLAGRIASRLYRGGASDGWRSPARYAFEIRATRRHGDRFVVTQSGATFLDLPGIDGVRWLLALESAQTLGPADDWRISPELAAELLKQPKRTFDPFEEPFEKEPWPFSPVTIRRLAAMQLLQYHGHDGTPVSWGYTVFERSRSLLEEIAEQRPTPFAVLADALLRDEVAYTLDRVRPDPALAMRESAAAATALQAQMVVHEIRNSLVPAQIALARLGRDLGEAAQAVPILKLRERVDAGIQRALTFVDQMLKVANLGAEATAPFDVNAAVRDAMAGVASELNGSLRPALPESALVLVGHRSRFVFAIINLLRNAAQAVAGKDGVVALVVEAHNSDVVVCVDDNGPGVPADQRRAIFEPGVALRLGGSGQGLALVRQVIEKELGGTVVCEESPLGGARFVLVIPTKKSRDT